jgi:spore germination protein YaaH
MSYEKNGDFKKWYDTTEKRNYWVLGYFGGGSINIQNAMEIAKEYSDELNLPFASIQIDEIKQSRRFKGFRILYSMKVNQEIGKDVEEISDIWKWLKD